MSRDRRPKRTTCSVCGNSCRVDPSEALWHDGQRPLGYWRWYSLTLCPPCKLAAHHFWQGAVAEAIASWSTRSQVKRAASMAVATAAKA